MPQPGSLRSDVTLPAPHCSCLTPDTQNRPGPLPSEGKAEVRREPAASSFFFLLCCEPRTPCHSEPWNRGPCAMASRAAPVRQTCCCFHVRVATTALAIYHIVSTGVDGEFVVCMCVCECGLTHRDLPTGGFPPLTCLWDSGQALRCPGPQ